MLFYKQKGKELTIPLEREERIVNYFTLEELQAEKGNALLFDWEIYPNYACVSFMSFTSEKVISFEISPDCELDREKLYWILLNFCIVGFNSQHFDIPITWLALTAASNQTLYEAAHDIIETELRGKELEIKYGFKVFKTNHIDIKPVAPLDCSLKLYAARQHGKRLQDLPIDPHKRLTKEEAQKVLKYNINDLELTRGLVQELAPQLVLRYRLGEEYNLDLRSKSDAQIAEAIIVSEVESINGTKAKRPVYKAGETFKYNIPDYINYKTFPLQQALEVIRNAVFTIPANGKMEIPVDIARLHIKIGSTEYALKIGGLHSNEKSISHYSNENVILIDSDVASFYPRIILNLGLYPKHLGKAFLKAYDKLVTTRLAGKERTKQIKATIKELEKMIAHLKDQLSENKLEALKQELENTETLMNGLKIAVNGGFGKLNNKYSNLCSPDLMIAVTMTGQLSLLMLIEMIELAGIPVISGNTDGIVIKCPKDRYKDLTAIIKEWENLARFQMEETRYKSIHCRDVNNYYAVKLKWDDKNKVWLDEIDGCKVKGCYSERGSALNSRLSKNPTNLVCSDAVMQFLTKAVPVEETIMNCKDITRFVTARNVKGGAQKDGIYLGKVVRWYYATGTDGEINYILSGNKVPCTDGAKPLMDLPDTLPDDINYKWYIEEANKYLVQIGVYASKDKAAQIAFW